MDQTLPPNPRRQFLGVATSAMGTLGLVAVAIPFVKIGRAHV